MRHPPLASLPTATSYPLEVEEYKNVDRTQKASEEGDPPRRKEDNAQLEYRVKWRSGVLEERGLSPVK